MVSSYLSQSTLPTVISVLQEINLYFTYKPKIALFNLEVHLQLKSCQLHPSLSIDGL